MPLVRRFEDWLHVQCQHMNKDMAWTVPQIAEQLPIFPGWSCATEAATGQAKCLWRQWSLSNFESVKMALHEIFHIADEQDHHPEVTFTYSSLTVKWSTHSADGITDNDWACAALVDDALRNLG